MPNLKIELLEIIEEQNELLKKKDGLIARLVNENAEMENFIDKMMREINYC